MSEPEVGYAFYRDSYRGELGQDAFERALPRALSEAGARIWPHAGSEDPSTWSRAVCAACDVEAAHGFSGGACESASFRLGSLSVSGQAGASGAYARDMSDAVGREIAGSPLAFAGLG